MPDEVKLLPCPFDGGEAFWAMDKCRGQCRACGALGPFNYDKTKAIAAWNTRAIEATRPPIGTDEVVERVMDEIVRLEGERENGPYVFSYVAVEQGIRAAMKDAASD